MHVSQLLQVYIAAYVLLVALQPPGLFHPSGCPRAFGVRPGETLLPAWLLAMFVALRLAAPGTLQ